MRLGMGSASQTETHHTKGTPPKNTTRSLQGPPARACPRIVPPQRGYLKAGQLSCELNVMFRMFYHHPCYKSSVICLLLPRRTLMQLQAVEGEGTRAAKHTRVGAYGHITCRWTSGLPHSSVLLIRLSETREGAKPHSSVCLLHACRRVRLNGTRLHQM